MRKNNSKIWEMFRDLDSQETWDRIEDYLLKKADEEGKDRSKVLENCRQLRGMAKDLSLKLEEQRKDTSSGFPEVNSSINTLYGVLSNKDLA